MKLDFRELYDLLMENPVVTYKMRQQLFNSPMGNETQVWYADGAAMMQDHSLHLYGNQDVLDNFLSSLEKGKKYNFFSTAKDYLPLLEQHFADIDTDEDCTAYTITSEDLRVGEIEHLESLQLDDAEVVNDLWTYKFDGSLDYFREIIATLPSSAIRIDSKLAGWAVCYDSTDDMINLGSLRVLDEHRNQGLGRKLSVDLINKVLKMGKVPMVHILDNNTPSKNLSMGIGFKPHPDKIFWGSGIKK